MEELEKGDNERKEKIQMLYQKFDGTNSRLEKIKNREQKALQERYAKQSQTSVSRKGKTHQLKSRQL